MVERELRQRPGAHKVVQHLLLQQTPSHALVTHFLAGTPHQPEQVERVTPRMLQTQCKSQRLPLFCMHNGQLIVIQFLTIIRVQQLLKAGALLHTHLVRQF